MAFSSPSATTPAIAPANPLETASPNFWTSVRGQVMAAGLGVRGGGGVGAGVVAGVGAGVVVVVGGGLG